MPKAKSAMSNLTPENRMLVDKLNFYREHITCVKCATTNTIYYIENDTKDNANKLKFHCNIPACPFKPTSSLIEKEISNLEKSIPYTPISNNSLQPINLTSKIPKPAGVSSSKRKTTNMILVDTEMENAVAGEQNQDLINLQIVTNNTESNNNPNQDSNNISALIIDLVKSLQTRLSKMEIQLTNTNNKNAALHQQIARMTKAMQLESIEENDINQMDEISTDETTEFPKLQFNRHIRSKSTPLTNSTQESKWAHPYTPGQMNNDNSNSNNKQNTKNTNKAQKNKKINSTHKNNNKKSYAEMLKLAQRTEKKAKQHQKNVNIATRYFTEITPENEGYEYLYFPSKGRTDRQKMRKQLKTLGVTNGRVLDIHYPEKKTIALLIHKMYRTELIQSLQQNGGIREKEHYDPTNPTIITNPEYLQLSNEERIQIAKQKHQARIVRALPFIRSPASKAVAKQFLENGTITQEQHDSFINNLVAKEQEAMNKNNTNSKQHNTTANSGTQDHTLSNSNNNNMVQDEDAPMTGVSSPSSNSL